MKRTEDFKPNSPIRVRTNSPNSSPFDEFLTRVYNAAKTTQERNAILNKASEIKMDGFRLTKEPYWD